MHRRNRSHRLARRDCFSLQCSLSGQAASRAVSFLWGCLDSLTIIFVFWLTVFSISSILGSHLFSKVVCIVLTLMPEFSALSLYAGHAGSITMISFPGLYRVEIARKTENLAPGETRMFCGFVFVPNVFVMYLASASLKSAIPFASPYFVYLLS